jgi:hypothetical protein
VAQEGHPLSGTWHGTWGSSHTPVLLYLKWDSKNVVGVINPGPDAVSMKVATLDPSKWMVHFEADSKDGMHIVIDGKLDNIGSYNRTITGTWTQGATKGDFKATRD